MKQIKEIPVDILNKHLEYDHIRGIIYRRLYKNKPCRKFKLRAETVGTHRNGYLCISLLNKSYLAHRVAYALFNNQSKFGIIDHKNGCATDNRIDNLHVVTNSFNLLKAPVSKNNKTGFKGIFFNKDTGFFESSIWLAGKKKHLGISKSKEVAIQLRKNATPEIIFRAI